MTPEASSNGILTIDIGTTSVKVSLFSYNLTPLCTVAEEYALDTRAGDIVEADPILYKRAIQTALRKARQKCSARIAAIAVTTQGETLIPVSRDGTPLNNAVVWLDARAKKQGEKLTRALDGGEFYRTTGLPDIGGALPLAKLMWFKEERPEIYRDTWRFLLLEDYILCWLTGRFLTEKSLLSSTGYYDITADRYWEKGLNAAGIDPEKLPDIMPCGAFAGTLTAETATLFDLPPDVRVYTGAMDQVAAAVGAGCDHPGMVIETTGTALVMAADTERPDFSHPSRVTIYRHAIDGHFLYLPIGVTAGMALKWFKDLFCADLNEGGQDVYARMDELAATVPPGCEGLITLPHLAGCINPENNPQAKAVFFGASLETTRAHFIRSIMESVGFLLRDFIEMLTPLGINASEICSLGGGSRSELWQQIKADCCGIPYYSLQCSEAASFGAAKLAAVGLGLTPPDTSGSVHRRFTPQKENKEAYEDAYRKYRALYQAVSPLYTDT